MARNDRIARDKQQMDKHQRQVRRSQIIMGVLSILIILSMVIGMIINL